MIKSNVVYVFKPQLSEFMLKVNPFVCVCVSLEDRRHR